MRKIALSNGSTEGIRQNRALHQRLRAIGLPNLNGGTSMKNSQNKTNSSNRTSQNSQNSQNEQSQNYSDKQNKREQNCK